MCEKFGDMLFRTVFLFENNKHTFACVICLYGFIVAATEDCFHGNVHSTRIRTGEKKVTIYSTKSYY